MGLPEEEEEKKKKKAKKTKRGVLFLYATHLTGDFHLDQLQ